MTEVTADVRPIATLACVFRTLDLLSRSCSALKQCAACSDFVLASAGQGAVQRSSRKFFAHQFSKAGVHRVASWPQTRHSRDRYQSSKSGASAHLFPTYIARLPRSNTAADAGLRQLCDVFVCVPYSGNSCLCCTCSCASPYSLLWLYLQTNLPRGCWGYVGLKSRSALEVTLW